MIEETLVSFFGSTVYAAKNIAALITKRVHVGKVPKNQANKFPRIYLQRTNKEYDVDIDGAKGNLIEDTFDLELISNNSSDLLTLNNHLWNDINCLWGSIASSQSVKGIFIENQSDDYEPKGTGGDLGLDVSSFQMRVLYAST